MNKLFTLACLTLVAASTGHAQPSSRTPNSRSDHIVVVCPASAQESPAFKDTRTGHVFPIVDPLLRAVAAKACEPDAGETGTPPANNVSVTNNRSTPIYVSFTVQNGTPGPITWATGANCVLSGVGIQVAAGQTCSAYVPPAANSSRFCAALDAAPANCWLAQTNHQTMIETTFLPASNGGCFSQGACVWYDISVIPSNCTDSAWAANMCAGTGGASYNLPVQTTCGGTATYTCQGPKNATWGPENYPSACGNPNATCTGNSPNCVNAYFFPMFSGPPSTHQPNQGCYGGNVLGITFMPGS
jgi:hypothetical protein